VGLLTYRRIDNAVVPAQDAIHGLFATSASDPAGHRYAIYYKINQFDGNTVFPLVFDIGPRILFGSFIGILIFSTALTFYLVLPITRMREAFERLAAGDLKVRLGKDILHHRDEISDMALDFNKMATRIEELVMSRDRTLADISHELRSPLARLQLAIALARQSPEKAPDSLHRIGLEADKLHEMIDELLALAKMESGVVSLDQHFFVSEIVAMVVNDARFEAETKGVEVKLVPGSGHLSSETMAVGSGKLISRAIENVVRNALRFSHPGDTVTVEVDSNSGGTTINIRDNGPGVKADQLKLIFEPFVQFDKSNGQGSGLGLSIARRAIIAHRGDIKATNGVKGGLTVTIWLPAASGSQANNDVALSAADHPVFAIGQ